MSITWQLELDAESTWRHLVDLDKWPAWLGSPIEGDLQPGAQLIVDHGDGYLCTSEVESVESEHSFVMSWSFPDEPRTWLELTVSRTGEDESVVVLTITNSEPSRLRTRVARPPHLLRGIRTGSATADVAVLAAPPDPSDSHEQRHLATTDVVSPPRGA